MIQHLVRKRGKVLELLMSFNADNVNVEIPFTEGRNPRNIEMRRRLLDYVLTTSASPKKLEALLALAEVRLPPAGKSVRSPSPKKSSPTPW